MTDRAAVLRPCSITPATSASTESNARSVAVWNIVLAADLGRRIAVWLGVTKNGRITSGMRAGVGLVTVAGSTSPKNQECCRSGWVQGSCDGRHAPPTRERQYPGARFVCATATIRTSSFAE